MRTSLRYLSPLIFAFLAYTITAYALADPIYCPTVKDIKRDINSCETPDCYVTATPPWDNLSDKHNILYPSAIGRPGSQDQLNNDISGMSLSGAYAEPFGYNQYLLKCDYFNTTPTAVARYGEWLPMSFQITKNYSHCTASGNTFNCS